MDLNCVTEILRPKIRAALADRRPGDAFLAGGTWLFSEPQPSVTRLIDLMDLGWPALHISEDGLHLAATCTIAQLASAIFPPAWQAARIVRPCCEALLGSFKIWHTATIGGNLCLALPAGPITALAAALDGTCTIWTQDGGERCLLALDFVTGAERNALAHGEILRAIDLPASALERRAAMRRISLNPLGRSAALLIGTTDGTDLKLTVTAATTHPMRLNFTTSPTAPELADAMAAIDPVTHDDVHGRPDWPRHVARLLAEDIRQDLAP